MTLARSYQLVARPLAPPANRKCGRKPHSLAPHCPGSQQEQRAVHWPPERQWKGPKQWRQSQAIKKTNRVTDQVKLHETQLGNQQRSTQNKSHSVRLSSQQQDLIAPVKPRSHPVNGWQPQRQGHHQNRQQKNHKHCLAKSASPSGVPPQRRHRPVSPWPGGSERAPAQPPARAGADWHRPPAPAGAPVVLPIDKGTPPTPLPIGG